MKLILFIFVLFSYCCSIIYANDIKLQCINVELLGATGNLAKKYLWQGLYNIFYHGLDDHNRIVLWPSATKSSDISQPILDQILEQNIVYKDADSKER